MNIVVKSKNEMDIEIPPGFIVLCDMDGTLVDTDYANYLSYRRAIKDVTFGKHDVQFNSRERFNRETLKEQIPCLDDQQYEDIVALKAGFFCEYLRETRLNTDLADFIRKCARTNEIVLVTCCQEKRAIETLQHHNLLGCFTRSICREGLSEGERSNKYVNALYLMGANPDTVLVFENETGDIEKAIIAGVPEKNIISLGHKR